MKRLFDFAVSSVALVLLSPVLLVLVWLVRRESAGPGIFRQTRVGREGRPFTCFKLRTMRQGTPDRPTHEMSADTVTPLGHRLRSLKLDELPQLWNVVKGEMSFVGPRPCLPSQNEVIEERRRRGVLRLRPGITGLAQIRGVDMSTPVRLAETDAEYARTRTFFGDIRIIIKTVLGRGQGDHVKA
ncbi:MAG: sugar transferase [Methylobacterium mesophilicum]|nr:sugar transferase [Methylobacterium mesophilicum]